MTKAIRKMKDPIKNNAPRTDLKLIEILEKNNLKELSKDIEARSDLGLKAYGDRLRPFNGRCVLTDLYQESLDALMYTMQAIQEEKIALEDGLLQIFMRTCEDLRNILK